MGKINMPVVPITAEQVGARPNTWMPTADDVGAVQQISELRTSILELALTLANGVYHYGFSGSSYSGTDLPDDAYVYSSASIYKRSANAITVILHETNTVPKRSNYYNGNAWGGWTKVFDEHTIVPVSKGGTGATTFTSGAALIGAGTGAVTTRAITNNTTSQMAGATTNLATCNTITRHVEYMMNRNERVINANTSYTVFMARGIALNTAVPSSLTNGCITFVYA